MATSNSISENAISFYASGGHAHDGVTSSLIKTNSYSIYDFNPSFVGDNPERRRAQVNNYNSFRQLVVNTINSTVLEPAGIVLQDNIINSRNIISGSITATEIAANTITADNIAANTITASEIAANTITANEISAGAVTASELAANIVLVNNYITSGNFDGTIAANGAVTSAGTTGWAVTSYGHAVFDTTFIRGSLSASEVLTPGVDIYSNGTLAGGSFTLYGNGAIVTSSGNFSVDASGNLTATNANITGEINATSGSISGNLVAGGTISSTDISGVNISGVNISGSSIDGSTITAGGRITLPSNGSTISLGTDFGGTATQVSIYSSGDQGLRIETSGMGESWFAGGTWYIGLQEFVSGRYITGLRTFVGSGTTLVVDSGGYVNRASSKRELKDNIQDFSDISLIDKLRPVTFTWKKDPRPNRVETEDEKIRRESSANIGFIAEEVEEASDGLLSIYNHNEDGEGEVEMYKHLDITALSVANIKDLRARVSSLEARIAELEG
jgi:hypothetical protein